MSILGRARGNVHALRILRESGKSATSLLTYPLRRRLGDNSLGGEGIALDAPAGYPLTSVVTEIFAQERYQPLHPIKEDSVVMDIGASIGAFAQWAAREWKPARIIAVEPESESFKYLNRNCSNAKIGAVNAAVAGEAGKRTLMRRGDLALNTLYARDVYDSVFEAAAEVRAITLEQLFSEHNIEQCDLLKLDCEGAEYEILSAAPERLLRSIGQVVGEYHVGLTANGPQQIQEMLSPMFDVQITPLLDPEVGYFYAARL